VPHPLAGSEGEIWPDLSASDLAGKWRVRSKSGRVDCLLSFGPASEHQPGTVTPSGSCPVVSSGLRWVYLEGTAQLVLLSGPGQAVWHGQRRGVMEFRAMKDGELLYLTPAGG